MLEKLKALNIDIMKGQDSFGEDYPAELLKFVKSLDFMRLGQAVNTGRFESAMMTLRRMSMQADKLGLVCFERQFTGLRQNIARKDATEVKNILSLVIRKRIQIQDVLKDNL
ncbi:MAG: hypothetical protein IJZ82_03255 [Lachnospiraceae bacterium]|nr:hypothetical protein [Lachnospiraceae bacterium]